MNTSRWFRRGASPLPRLAILGTIGLALAGCDVDDILDVTDPDIADPGAFGDAAALAPIRAGVLGDFHVAYVGTPQGGGGTEGQILISGLLGDEWIHSGTFPTRSEIDIRQITINNGTVQNTTRNLYRARASAEAAVASFEELDPNTAGHAEMLSLAGFTYVYFGENYCSGVPFSQLNPDATFTFGGQETTEQIFTRALNRADAAIGVATAAESSTHLNLARVLKGRALLNLGQYEEAAAAVAAVPTSFRYLDLASENTSREQNGVYTLNAITERWSVANNEGGNGLPYRTAFTNGDPRTPWRRAGNDVGFDRRTPQYDQRIYPSRSAPTPIANGIEARLIEAEAALQRGDNEEFISTLNDLRANVRTLLGAQYEDFNLIVPDASLDPVTDPGTQEGRVDLLFQERAFWLWLTSHRLGDMRRLIRQYGRAAEDVFPVGDYHKNVFGGVYGDDINIPISIDERNNPEFADFPPNEDLCLHRGA